MKNVYGIWIGEKILFANTEKLSIIFLREDMNIISLTKDNGKLLSVTYAEFIDDKYKFTVCMLDTSGKTMVSSVNGKEYINCHESDSYIINGDALLYKTYNGKIYEGELAERIYIDTLINNSKNDEMPSIAKRLEMWNLGTYYEHDDEELKTQIKTHKYSIVYNTSAIQNYHYCRFGVNGYCEEGYALLPLVAIQSNGVQMPADFTEYKDGYKPNIEYFTDFSCNFPEDGSWCWSLKSEDEKEIVLYGCNLGEYSFSPPKESDLYEIIR